MNLKKAKTIVKAFSEDLPVEQEWYRDRLAECDTCEYNSKNIENNSILTKTKENTICRGTSVCDACGCCIAQKASVKSEVCGMAEKGLTPKWEALEIENTVDKNIVVENLTEGSDKFYVDDTGMYVVELSTPELTAPFSFIVDGGKGLNIRTLVNTCSCTSSGVNELSQGRYEVHMTVSTKNFTKGQPTNKTVVAKYTIGKGKEKDLRFKFKITKTK